jgi:Domain of unknown function (DUF5666)
MSPRTRSSYGALRAALSVIAALLLATACGGGSGDMPSGSAFTQGTINGFGSVIVNGIRFDDSAAQVLDDDGQPHSSGDLKLGMNVDVDSGDIDRGSNSAKANRIRFGAAIVGPVSAISTTTTPQTLTVLDETVEVSSTTVFDNSLVGGIAAIQVGDILAVHALFDTASGHYLAKRIEPDPAATVFKVRGIVANLDAAAMTFMVGSALIDFSGVPAASLPTLANGLRVRVRLQTAKNSAGAWVAISIQADRQQMEDRDEAEVRGTITDFTSTASFSVNGLPVDASKAAFPDGTAGIVKGAMVEVEGAIVNGVLVASKVELEDRHHDNDANELHGAISNLDTTAQTFVVRGVTVHYSATTVFKDGTQANLANGVMVEVKGMLSADGTTVEAASIEFANENEMENEGDDD